MFVHLNVLKAALGLESHFIASSLSQIVDEVSAIISRILE